VIFLEIFHLHVSEFIHFLNLFLIHVGTSKDTTECITFKYFTLINTEKQLPQTDESKCCFTFMQLAHPPNVQGNSKNGGYY